MAGIPLVSRVPHNQSRHEAGTVEHFRSAGKSAFGDEAM